MMGKRLRVIINEDEVLGQIESISVYREPSFYKNKTDENDYMEIEFYSEALYKGTIYYRSMVISTDNEIRILLEETEDGKKAKCR